MPSVKAIITAGHVLDACDCSAGESCHQFYRVLRRVNVIRHLGVLFTFIQSKDISKSSMSAVFEGLVLLFLRY